MIKRIAATGVTDATRKIFTLRFTLFFQRDANGRLFCCNCEVVDFECIGTSDACFCSSHEQSLVINCSERTMTTVIILRTACTFQQQCHDDVSAESWNAVDVAASFELPPINRVSCRCSARIFVRRKLYNFLVNFYYPKVQMPFATRVPIIRVPCNVHLEDLMRQLLACLTPVIKRGQSLFASTVVHVWLPSSNCPYEFDVVTQLEVSTLKGNSGHPVKIIKLGK